MPWGLIPAGAFQPGGLLNPARAPFWGLNDKGICNEDLLYYPDPWDTFWVNDDQFPGRCWLEGKSISAIEVEKKKGKGSSGAKITFYGYEAGEFDIVCRIATPEQWDLYQGIQDKYWAGPSKTEKPPQLTVKVNYPDLIRLRIFQAVLIAIPPAENSDVDGAKHFRWKFHENVPQKPHKAKSAGGASPPIDPRRPGVGGAPLNAIPALPSTSPTNMSLDGPQLSTHGGAK